MWNAVFAYIQVLIDRLLHTLHSQIGVNQTTNTSVPEKFI